MPGGAVSPGRQVRGPPGHGPSSPPCCVLAFRAALRQRRIWPALRPDVRARVLRPGGIPDPGDEPLPWMRNDANPEMKKRGCPGIGPGRPVRVRPLPAASGTPCTDRARRCVWHPAKIASPADAFAPSACSGSCGPRPNPPGRSRAWQSRQAETGRSGPGRPGLREPAVPAGLSRARAPAANGRPTDALPARQAPRCSPKPAGARGRRKHRTRRKPGPWTRIGAGRPAAPMPREHVRMSRPQPACCSAQDAAGLAPSPDPDPARDPGVGQSRRQPVGRVPAGRRRRGRSRGATAAPVT